MFYNRQCCTTVLGTVKLDARLSSLSALPVTFHMHAHAVTSIPTNLHTGDSGPGCLQQWWGWWRPQPAAGQRGRWRWCRQRPHAVCARRGLHGCANGGGFCRQQRWQAQPGLGSEALPEAGREDRITAASHRQLTSPCSPMWWRQQLVASRSVATTIICGRVNAGLPAAFRPEGAAPMAVMPSPQ